MNWSLRLEGYWTVRGTHFSPSAAERATGMPFTTKHEPGELGSRGRYRGVPMPDGYASRDFSVPPETEDLVAANSDLLAELERCLPHYRAAGALHVALHYNVCYSSQCNMEFSPALLRRLAALDVVVALTCYPFE